MTVRAGTGLQGHRGRALGQPADVGRLGLVVSRAGPRRSSPGPGPASAADRVEAARAAAAVERVCWSSAARSRCCRRVVGPALVGERGAGVDGAAGDQQQAVGRGVGGAPGVGRQVGDRRPGVGGRVVDVGVGDAARVGGAAGAVELAAMRAAGLPGDGLGVGGGGGPGVGGRVVDGDVGGAAGGRRCSRRPSTACRRAPRCRNRRRAWACGARCSRCWWRGRRSPAWRRGCRWRPSRRRRRSCRR